MSCCAEASVPEGSDATAVGRTAAVVRQWSDVDDLHHFDTCAVNRTDCRFATCAGTFDINFNLTQSKVVSNLCAIGCCSLSCIGSVLLRTAETHLACRRPADNFAYFVGQGYYHVVEGRMYVCCSQCANLDNLLLNCSSLFCHNSLKLLGCFFLVSDSLFLALAGTGIVLGALAAHGESETVTDSAIAADIHEALDVQLD